MEVIASLAPILAPVLAFVVVVLVVLAVSGAFAARVTYRDRIAAYAGGPEGAAPSAAVASSDVLRDRRLSTIAGLDKVLSRSGWAERTAVSLASAGMPLRVGEYLLVRWVVACAFLLLGLTFGLNPIFALVPGLIGFYLPVLYVRRRQANRLQQFNDQLLDALIMMANALKSGSSFLQALEMVSREQPAPISEEFGQIVAEVSVGGAIDDSLRDLGERISSYELYMVLTAILVQRATGGNLSEVLENIAHTIRERIRILGQMRVETAQKRISAYVLGGLPVFMLVALTIVNPNYTGAMLNSDMGRVILATAFVLQLLGFYIMQRLVQIDI